LAYTQKCLESLRRNTPQGHEVIVVDNGSSDGTIDFLRQSSQVRLIENAENRGYPAAANQSIQAARGGYALLLNNDVVVPAGWLGRLLAPFERDPRLGLAGPRTNRISGPQQIVVSYRDLADLDRFAADHAGRHAGELHPATRLVGFCLLIRREVIDTIGLLDERFGMGNFEDDDFCRRAIGAGFGAAIVGDAYVHHFGSASFTGNRVDLGALLRKNQAIYDEKWKDAAPLTSPVISPLAVDAPALSLCMIVRDAEGTIGPCLQSVRPFVDEMIVVDTGSTDATIQIARSLGAKVFEFPWCDSFAIARNESLKNASGRWIFWMDADDTIDQANGNKLRQLVQRPSPSAPAYVLQVHCPGAADDDGYATATVVDHVKVFANRPEIRFTGRIHEQVLPSIRRMGGNVEWTDIFVTHSGSDLSAAGRTRKFARDLRLLELELADDPDSPFALFNFGMTLVHAGKPADALGPLCRSLQLSAPTDSHVRKVYALLAWAYARLDRAQTALKTCVQGLALFPSDPELTFRKAAMEQSLGQLAEAEATYQRLLETPRDRHFSSIDQGIVGVKAWHNLAIVRQRQNNYAGAAAAWRKALDHDRGNVVVWRGWVNALAIAKNASTLEAIAAGDCELEVPGEIKTLACARALAERGQTAAAMDQLQRAVEGGGSTELLDELCRLAFTTDAMDIAKRWLGELSRRRPGDPSVHLNLGVVYSRLGDWDRSVEEVKKSLELRPGYRPAEELLARAQVVMANRG
jgi:GT2 family glycosyltransferase/tetratricopeptide (TPR) repeat protein